MCQKKGIFQLYDCNIHNNELVHAWSRLFNRFCDTNVDFEPSLNWKEKNSSRYCCQSNQSGQTMPRHHRLCILINWNNSVSFWCRVRSARFTFPWYWIAKMIIIIETFRCAHSNDIHKEIIENKKLWKKTNRRKKKTFLSDWYDYDGDGYDGIAFKPFLHSVIFILLYRDAMARW